MVNWHAWLILTTGARVMFSAAELAAPGMKTSFATIEDSFASS